jgi:hypothetical protein
LPPPTSASIHSTSSQLMVDYPAHPYLSSRSPMASLGGHGPTSHRSDPY